MSDLIFLTGPVRSGKSRRAVDMARAWGGDAVYVATYRHDPADAEMSERVRRHKAERPGWRTLEAPNDIGAALGALDPTPSGVVIDSIVLWAADRFGRSDADILAAWTGELERLRAAPYPAVVIGDEIGWTPVPVEASLRRFRDLCGFLGQETAARATEAWLMVAGCAVRLK